MTTTISDPDLFAEFEEKPTNEAMARLQEQVEEHEKIAQWIEKHEALIKKGKNRLEELESKLIPDTLSQCGQTECRLTNGLHVKTETQLFANIPAETTINKCKDPDEREALIERRDKAMNWLEENAPDVIKRSFEIQFSRSPEDQALADKFERDLKQRKRPLPVHRSMTVHAQTLNKLMRDRHEESLPLPHDLFAIHMATRAIIKR